jgi:hypothetical protein
MNAGAASLPTLQVYGGEWYANSSMTDVDSLFSLVDVRYAKFVDVLFGGDIDFSVHQAARAVSLVNDYWWCERNSFINCSFENIQHAVVFEIASTAGTNGGTQSFARTMVKGCTVQGGITGESLFEFIDSTSGTVGEPGAYGSVFEIGGNILSGVSVMKLTGAMGGTIVGPMNLEAASGTAYYFKIGTQSGTRPTPFGSFIDSNVDMFDPGGTATDGYLLEDLEHHGGLTSYGATPNYNVDILGRISAFDTTRENPYVAVSGTSGGASALDAFGHLIIGGGPDLGRDVAVVTGTTPAVRALFKGNGDIIFVPDATTTPANNGELGVEATSNSTLSLKFKGSDSTERSIVLPLDTGGSTAATVGNPALHNYGTGSLLTISSGAITVTDSWHTVAGEGGSADTLDTINGGSAGDILVLTAASDIVNITITQSGGNIDLDGATFVLDSWSDIITLMYITGSINKWVQLSRTSNA